MNNKLEQCINRVQDEIKTIESSLADTGNHLTTAAEQEAESLEANWKNALAKCDAKREEAGQAGQRLRQYLVEKKDELIAKYGSSRQVCFGVLLMGDLRRMTGALPQTPPHPHLLGVVKHVSSRISPSCLGLPSGLADMK